MRFRTQDELGNDWSPDAYKDKKSPNVKRNQFCFSNFDFALMTRAEINFLEKLANGENPYPKSALKEYGQSVRGYKQDSNQWEFVQLFRPEVLQNSLNWAPLNEELVSSISGQKKQYIDFYTGLFPLDKEERYGGQRPDVFILNWYVSKKKGPFSSSIIGDLDKFITAGVDPNLQPDHQFYGRIIPPRELVYWIRRKYGIASAPDQTVADPENNGGRSEFKSYYNQFLFEEENSIVQNLGPDAYWVASNLKNKIFKDRMENTKVPAAIKTAFGGRTLSQQAFITRAMQFELFKKPSPTNPAPLNDGTRGELGWFLNELYLSINTQRLLAHKRAILMLDELNRWGKVVELGLKNGNIIPVLAEVKKKGNESKILSSQEHLFIQRNMNPSILGSKQNEYNKIKVIQYISNIPDDVSKKRNIPNYQYHIRQWNRTGGSDNNPLFQSPEYSSDFSNEDCLNQKSTYFMRNLIRPLVEDFLNPSKYSKSSDKEEPSVYLTISELQKRMTKELPFLSEETPVLSNRDYNVIKNITKNANENGTPVSGTGLDIAARENVEKFLKESGVNFKIYYLKKNLSSSIITTIIGLSTVHWLSETIAHLEPTSKLFTFVEAIGQSRFVKINAIKEGFHSFGHAIHGFEKFLEPALVGFKVVSAIMNITLYNDAAAWLGLSKEVVIGTFALENVFATTGAGISASVFAGLGPAGASALWVGILVGVSLWIDDVGANVRQWDKQRKFKKLIEEAHKAGYIEGVYAETGGELLISKKDVKNIKLSSTAAPEKVGEEISYGNSFITSKEELMGAKGKKIFWDRISKNPFECKTLLDIAGQPKFTSGRLTGRYNSLLNTAPNQKDYGVFTTEDKYNIDQGRNTLVVGSRNHSSTDAHHPFINVFLASSYNVKPTFKYTRKKIQYDTDLKPYLTGIEKSSEFEVTRIIARNPDRPGQSEKYFVQSPILEGRPPTDKEKVWLIRKKYGLDLINTEAGNNCCNTKKPINSSTVTDAKNFPSDNIRLDSQKQFLTGEPNQVAIVGTDGKVKNELRYKVGCEYLVDLADPDVINKLREICSKKEEIPKDDKTSGKKTSKSPSGKNNIPVLSYNDQLNNEVQNMNLVNYLTQMGTSNQQLYQEKGGDGATAGTNDQLPSLMGSPRFGQKASVEVFAQNQSPVPTNGISQWLVGFATMDIHADLVNFINTLATAFATSYDGNPVPSNKIDLAALNTPLGGSNYFQWTPYGELPTETESSRTMDSGFGTPTTAPPRTRG